MALCLSGYGCKKDDEKKTDESVVTSAFLTSEELAPPADPTAIEPTDLKDYLLSNLDLFQATDNAMSLVTADEDNTTFEKFEACSKEITDQFVIKASGDHFTYGMNADLLKCFGEGPQTVNGSTITFDVYKTTVFFALTCTGADFSDFEGKTLEEFIDSGDSEFSCDQGGTILSNSRTSTSYTLVDKDRGVNAVIKSLSISSMSTPESEACTIKKDGEILSYANACQSIDLTKTTGNNDDEVSYRKLVYGDVTWKDSPQATWYSSGTMAATLNNWTGNVVFTGPQTAPTYTFNNGTETLTGSIAFGLRQAQGRSALSAHLFK